MAYPRRVTDSMLDRIEQVARQRLAVPSDKQLAQELGCNIKLVQRWLTRKRVTLLGSMWKAKM